MRLTINFSSAAFRSLPALLGSLTIAILGSSCSRMSVQQDPADSSGALIANGDINPEETKSAPRIPQQRPPQRPAASPTWPAAPPAPPVPVAELKPVAAAPESRYLDYENYFAELVGDSAAIREME